MVGVLNVHYGRGIVALGSLTAWCGAENAAPNAPDGLFVFIKVAWPLPS